MKWKGWDLLVTILLFAAAAATHAAQFGDFTYESSGTEVTITGYTGPGGVLTIPDSINCLPVTGVGHEAFRGCTRLTSVRIPYRIFNIANSAFWGCTGLTAITVDELNPHYSSVEGVLLDKNQTILKQCPQGKAGTYTIPNGVTGINYWAFGECKHLTGITIPDSVTFIGQDAFWGCTSLYNVTIGDGVKSLGWGAFESCPLPDVLFSVSGKMLVWFPFRWWTASYAIPDGVTTIADYAFRNSYVGNVHIPNTVTNIGRGTFQATGFSTVTIPDSVTSIGDEAFAWSRVTTVIIPDSIPTIGRDLFRGCPIKDVLFSVSGTMLFRYPFEEKGDYTIPATVNRIAPSAFAGSTNLTSVTIPESVTTIPEWAFSGCTGLSGVTIPNSLASIGEYAFAYCTGLTSLTIPRSVTNIGYHAFYDCSSLSEITVNPLNADYSSADGVLFDKNRTKILWFPRGKAGGYTIPDRVTVIEWGAFSGCTSLNSITIPDSVTSIGMSAFQGCYGLTNVTIGKHVTNIYMYNDPYGGPAFKGCTNLTGIAVDDLNTTYSSVDGVLFDKSQTALVLCPRPTAGSYSIPPGIQIS